MATVVGMSRHSAITTSLIVVTALLAGCAPGLAANPRFATNAGARPQGKATKTTAAQRSAADRQAEERVVVARLHIAGIRRRRSARAPGVKLDCASYDADLDPVNGAAGTLSIGVVRARSAQTPHDAGPLVFTTGSDLPSSLQLPVWLARAGADVLQNHPIVAIDRRGMGIIEPGRLPRPVRSPGDPRPGAVRGRQRPGRQPRRHRAERHHQLHRHHRAR